MGRPAAAASVVAALVDAASVVAAWCVLVFVENLAVALLWPGAFSGSWEVTQARRLVTPVAIAGLAPASAIVVGGWSLARRACDGVRPARFALGALGGLAGGALALGVATGRHLAALPVRTVWVAALAFGGVVAATQVVPRVARLHRRPAALGLVGAAVCVAGWLADALVLPRLYPAFHLAMLAAALTGAALVGLAARTRLPWIWVSRVGAVAIGLVVVSCAARARRSARDLEPLSNLRVALVEHAPIAGRVIAVLATLQPPADTPPDTAAEAPPIAPGEVARALDWTGHDLVLFTVDALRADHVSAYGYRRPTTPNLDALAAAGTTFVSAYCPTPHTSYSLTSMMTGKYLRPLLTLGIGADSETWAQDLRRYGWRTAAFYPPAVFFIDEERFTSFERATMGFEYAKVEFADPALREAQVRAYLDGAPPDARLFLWVHFFEPHEPYVMHPEHPFDGGRSADEDAYDSEIAAADDGIGRIVRLVQQRRPGAIVVATADHGEEFGEHGGHYHGTTVYEEQVRVPLVVVGPGVRRAARVDSVVQTIDLLPTTLSALGIPRPARLRGRDLGSLLAGKAAPADEGFAFAETDDYALVAQGRDRLVCQRRAAACTLLRPADDPSERVDRASQDPVRFASLREALRAVERDHGRFEGAATSAGLPEALRRGLQGDAEAAADVASLLDDADVGVRRKAAEVCYALHAPATVAPLRRALGHDEDEVVRRWAALALVRIGESPPGAAEALLRDPDVAWRRRAAIAFGEHGDGRACDTLAAWWADEPPRSSGQDGEPPRIGMELADVEQLLGATSIARCRAAVPSLVRALADVRARPFLADALGALGDERARTPLLGLLAVEPYVTTRRHEAHALVQLGAYDWPTRGAAAPGPQETAALRVGESTQRIVVLLSGAVTALDASVDGAPLTPDGVEGDVRSYEVRAHGKLELRASGGGVVAVWLLGAAT